MINFFKYFERILVFVNDASVLLLKEASSLFGY